MRHSIDAPIPPLLADDPHDQALSENTHPREWPQPNPRAKYGLVVLGGGTAGLVSAAVGAMLGAKVALVERAYTGGDCLVTGCVPSKSLLRAARAAADVRRAGAFGIHPGGDVQVDFSAAMARLRSVRATISQNDAAATFRDKYGVDVFFGNATFADPEHVQVNGQTLHFRRAIVATGARAAESDIPGLAEVGFFTNETIFNLTERPLRLVVIGGGPLGCEMAQAFSRLGSRVTVLQRRDRLLPHDDAEAAEILFRVFQDEDISVRLGAVVERVTPGLGDAKIVHVRSRDGHNRFEADAILVATGRAPNVAGLNLEAGHIRYSERGVDVDDHLRTTNRRVFAAGDVCLKEKFTHAADASARLAVQNALLFPMKRWSRQIVPHVTYTEPEIAHVGLSETGAAERGPSFHTCRLPMHDVDRATTDGEDTGYIKVYSDRRSGRIAGATIVAAHAGEMISQVTIAMAAGLKLKKLSEIIFPYPTLSEAIKKLADDEIAASLRGWRTSLLKALMRWTRRR